MLSTSSLYDTAIKSPIRKFSGRVEITWTDPYIDNTIVITANDTNRIHDQSDCIYHAADLITTVPYKYAHLNSQGTYPLIANGTFHPFPGTDLLADSNEVGWWGAEKCNSEGEWVTSGTTTTTTTSSPLGNPVLTMTFTSRSIYSLLVCGEDVYGEYPVSFIVRIYTLSGDAIPILTETVTNEIGTNWARSGVVWTKTLSPIVSSAQKMELEIVKWSEPFAVVKIAEFYTSIVDTYTDDDIISLELLEEMEIADGSLPIGNISCNELDIKLQNVDDRFFVGNTNSPIYTLIKKNRRIRAWIGLELPDGSTEEKLLGTFFSGDWQADELGTYVSTSARDRMELLRKTTFDISELYEDKTLYWMADTLLADAKLKIPDLIYQIDTELLNYTLPYLWFEKISYFECIKKIVGACMGYAYMSKGDVLIIGVGI